MTGAGAGGWRIVRDDLTHPAVVALVEFHLRAAFSNSPPKSVFALDVSKLRAPGIALWTVWEGAALLGMGALKHLDDAHGELKSMRTAPDQLRRGVAAVVVEHLLAEARARGYRRVSLETGSSPPYDAARALYERVGFVPCGAFAEYRDEAFSRYYTLTL